MHSLKLPALYTLQDRLARDAKQVSGFEHGHVTFGHVLHEARTQFVVESDAPRCTGFDLLSGDETIVEPAMQGGGGDAERLRGAFHRHAWRLVCLLLRGLEARDIPVRAQTAHAIRGERQAGGRVERDRAVRDTRVREDHVLLRGERALGELASGRRRGHRRAEHGVVRDQSKGRHRDRELRWLEMKAAVPVRVADPNSLPRIATSRDNYGWRSLPSGTRYLGFK